MKKTYINPSLEVVRIQTVGMLANSLTMGVNSSNDKAVENISDLLGRDDDGDWEDEEF